MKQKVEHVAHLSLSLIIIILVRLECKARMGMNGGKEGMECKARIGMNGRMGRHVWWKGRNGDVRHQVRLFIGVLVYWCIRCAYVAY